METQSPKLTSQKRRPDHEGVPYLEDNRPAKEHKNGVRAESTGAYSENVRKKIQNGSRTGQACDRCKERKMRCDTNSAGCLNCTQKKLQCVTTDRISGRPLERGQSDRLETELVTLRRHLAIYQQKYGPLHDGEPPPIPTAANDQSARPSYLTSTPYAHDPLPSSGPMGTSGQVRGQYEGPIRGTIVDVLDGEIDIADYICPEMAEPDFTNSPVFNQSKKSFVRSFCGAQRPKKPTLPPKEEAIKSIETFAAHVLPYIPIVHGPTVLASAHKYFDNTPPQLTTSEEAIILLILANQNYQVAVRNPGVARAKLKDSNEMFHYGLSLMCDLWMDQSLVSMQAMALLLLHVRVLPKPGYTWHFSLFVLGRAIELGYHRSWSASIPTEERHNPLAQEMRKRVFWVIFTITVSTGVKLGLPIPLRIQDIDVGLPLPLEDSEISTAGIASVRSGKCSFWPGLSFWRLQPLLMDLYHDLITVRKPSAEYLQTLESLNDRIVQWRQQWDKDISVEVYNGGLEVATHHMDSWAAEFQLILHHPKLCTANSPEVMQRNLQISHEAARKLLSSADDLYSVYRAVDFTWHSTVGYVLALGVVLHIYYQHKHRITPSHFEQIKHELSTWMKIMKVADKVLYTNQLYERFFRFRIGKLLRELQTGMAESPAVQDGVVPHPTDTSGGNGSGASQAGTTVAYTQQHPQYGSMPYPNAHNNSAPTDTGNQLSAAYQPHPPVQPESYQYQQQQAVLPRTDLPTSNTYLPSSELTTTLGSYTSTGVAQNQAVVNSLTYPHQQPSQDQHQHTNDMLALTQGWDDTNTQALWPNVIMSMQRPLQHQSASGAL